MNKNVYHTKSVFLILTIICFFNIGCISSGSDDSPLNDLNDLVESAIFPEWIFYVDSDLDSAIKVAASVLSPFGSISITKDKQLAVQAPPDKIEFLGIELRNKGYLKNRIKTRMRVFASRRTIDDFSLETTDDIDYWISDDQYRMDFLASPWNITYPNEKINFDSRFFQDLSSGEISNYSFSFTPSIETKGTIRISSSLFHNREIASAVIDVPESSSVLVELPVFNNENQSFFRSFYIIIDIKEISCVSFFDNAF